MSESKTRKEYALDAIDHIAYEIKMFLFCITQFIIKSAEGNFYYTLVESFALHFRNLYEFFNNKQNLRFKGDDNTVFYADIKRIPIDLKEVKDDYNRASKKIAHIDRNRTLLKQDGWNHYKLYRVFRTPILILLKDSEILSFIKETDLISEIKKYIDLIDMQMKNTLNDKVDTASGSVSITSSIIQG